MSLLGGHLGSRTSALLDGQLCAAESERAWAHVAECGTCHDLVEREAWLKRRLACLGQVDATEAPSGLKGDLLGAPALRPRAAYDSVPARSRRALGIAALGGTALGAAFMGVLTIGAGPADAPAFQRHAPVSSVSTTPTIPTTAFVRATQR